MATGTVKFFNSQKGFGFIQQENGGPDVFVHVSAVERAGMRGLVEGQKVSFEIEADQRSGKSAAANLQEGQSVVVQSLQERFNESAGVNIDQEMANLLNLQNAYAANARVLSAVKEMLDQLMQL